MKKLSAMIWAGICVTAFLSFPACDTSYDRYENAALYTAGDFTYSAAQVAEIEIDWVGGSIEIEQGVGDSFAVRESATMRNTTEKMHHYLDGTTLKIEYCSSGYKGSINENDKNLYMEIPVGVQLEIETVNAPVAIGSVSVSSLSVESVSGNITGEKWISESDVDIDTVSGSLTVGQMTAKSLEINSKSGAFSVEQAYLSQIEGETKSGNIKLGAVGSCLGELETNSGNVTLVLLEGVGLVVDFDTFSGDLITGKTYDHQGKKIFPATSEYYWQLKVDTLSGDLIVE